MWPRDVDLRIRAALAQVRRAAVITLSKLAAEGVTLQANGDGIDDVRDARLFQHYGFASSPHPGGEGVVLWLGPDRPITIATEDLRYRLELVEGEVALYTDEGDRVHLKRGGAIDVVASGLVTVQAPTVALDAATVTVSGDLEVEGGVTVSGDLGVEGGVTAEGAVEGSQVRDAVGTLNALRVDYLVHVHTDPVSGVTGGPQAP